MRAELLRLGRAGPADPDQARSLVTREFVEAARSVGSTGWWVITRELLPNLLGPVLVIATMAIPGYIGAEAALSFLGVGVPPPTPSLGRSISDSIAWVYTGNDPWFMVFPGIAAVRRGPRLHAAR